ncbi:MAG: hypothetical protein Q7U82_15375 [Gammaproteobacteria bacterium]|nr:hypothetical protein [Gammaproteobacteria bacterium]
MRITNILLVVLGLGLGLGLAVFIVLQAGEVTLLPALQTVGSVATAFSATIAFGLYMTTLKRHQKDDSRKSSETYMREVLSVLEKAYETLVQQGDSPPANDRLLWLSAARMIVRFQKLREKVTEADHLAVIDENEENVRLKFYTLLSRNAGNFTRQYFSPESNQCSGVNINRKSMAVIFAFSRWKDDMPDPLSTIDDIELYARGALPIDQNGAEEYLEGFTGYWQKVQEKKEEINTKRP